MKISPVAIERIQIFKESQRTIGMDLGDRSGHYCILNEAGEVIWESKLPTTPKGSGRLEKRNRINRTEECRIDRLSRQR